LFISQEYYPPHRLMANRLIPVVLNQGITF
jgi:hypothetical protein